MPIIEERIKTCLNEILDEQLLIPLILQQDNVEYVDDSDDSFDNDEAEEMEDQSASDDSTEH